MQDRFMKRFSRRMTARDMQAWSARADDRRERIANAFNDTKTMFDFLKGPISLWPRSKASG